MDVDFLGQPWQDGSNLDDFLAEVTAQKDPYRLRIAVAWAKRSGLIRIRPHLDTWRQSGGTIAMVIGLSEGGATRQGLEEALEVADSVHLFHDVSGRTFHPKVYLAETTEATSLLVGSNNMTAGGLYFNYEAAVAVRVPATEVPSSTILKQAEGWFDRLLNDPDCCRELTNGELAALLSNPAYRIGDEDKRRQAAKGETGAPEEIDAVTPTRDEEATPFFGKSQSVKKKARHEPPAVPGLGAGEGGPGTAGGGAVTKSSSTKPKTTVTAPQTPTQSPSAQAPVAVMRWSKRMKGTDAQQPPGVNTQPTYNLRLAAAGHPINIKEYFRKDFFNTTQWQTDPADPNIEYTVVNMEVYIYGKSQGVFPFRVDHDLRRVSGQGNVPTVLKWGPMSDYMLKHNHVDDWALLEKYEDGTFTLKIEATDPVTK